MARLLLALTVLVFVVLGVLYVEGGDWLSSSVMIAVSVVFVAVSLFVGKKNNG